MVGLCKKILQLHTGSCAGIFHRIDIGGVGHVELGTGRERAAAGRKAKAAQLLVGDGKGGATHIRRCCGGAAQAIKIADENSRRRAPRFCNGDGIISGTAGFIGFVAIPASCVFIPAISIGRR